MSLIRLELAQYARSGLFLGILALYVAMMAHGLWAGAAEHARWAKVVAANRAQAETAIEREQENVRLSRQEGFYAPGAPSAQTMDASLPPAPGVILSRGDGALRPVTAWVSVFTRADTLFRNVETESALIASLGALDPSWIVIVLLPLLAIALNHDLLSGERDAGRIGLLRVQSRSLAGVAVMRIALRFLLPWALVSAAALCARALGTPTAVACTWWLIASLYLMFWSLLAGWIGVRARAAGAAAAALLVLWLGFVVIVPAAITLGVGWLSGTPSRIAQVIATREVQLGLQERMAELLDRYIVDHPELVGASAGGFARSYFVAQRETEQRLAPVLEQFTVAHRRQASWNARLAWLSPAMLAYGGMTQLAGTGGGRHEAFEAQANRFAAAWREHLHDPLFLDRALTVAELDALPRFRFDEPPVGARPAAVAAGLVLFCLLLAVLLRRELRDEELR
jgi:ABC-2 type transport system permease protein